MLLVKVSMKILLIVLALKLISCQVIPLPSSLNDFTICLNCTSWNCYEYDNGQCTFQSNNVSITGCEDTQLADALYNNYINYTSQCAVTLYEPKVGDVNQLIQCSSNSTNLNVCTKFISLSSKLETNIIAIFIIAVTLFAWDF